MVGLFGRSEGTLGRTRRPRVEVPPMNPRVPTAFRRRLSLLIVGTLITTVAPYAVLTSSAAAAPTYDVTVTRTEYGIPHIVAADFGSVGYGFGYGFAQDNICVMADDYVTVRGD